MRPTHPRFVDMTGQTIAGYEVLSRAPNSPGRSNAQWHCRHSCGGLVILQGIVLRSRAPSTCEHCVQPRGSVTRQANWSRAFHYCGCTPTRPCPRGALLFEKQAEFALRAHLRVTLRPMALLALVSCFLFACSDRAPLQCNAKVLDSVAFESVVCGRGFNRVDMLGGHRRSFQCCPGDQ